MHQPPPLYRQHPPRLSTKGLWCLVLVAFALLYGWTCQRGFSWQDSAIYQYRALDGDLEGWMGLALAHPLFIAMAQVARLLPEATVAWGLSFVSSLGMAVALANLSAVAALLSGRRWIGLATAAMLGVAHTTWWLASITETYTWSVAGLTAELWLLVLLFRRPGWGKLAGLALVSGLGLCVHNLALLPLPVYVAVAAAMVVRRKLPAWSLAVAAGAFLLGASPYLALAVQLAVRSGDVWATVRSALVGGYGKAVFNVSATSVNFTGNAALAAMNFVSFLLPLTVIGWVRLRRWAGGPLAAALAAITGIEVLFVLRYPVPDQFMFLLPSLVMMALAAGLGAATLAEISKGWRDVAIAACTISLVLPPAFCAVAPSLIEVMAIPVPRRAYRPFRNEMRYWLKPWKYNERSAEQFAAAALRQAAPNGVILADTNTRPMLLLVQKHRKLSPHVAVQFQGGPLPRPTDPDAFLRALGDRPLFATGLDADELPPILRRRLDDEPPGDGEVLYRLRPRP